MLTPSGAPGEAVAPSLAVPEGAGDTGHRPERAGSEDEAAPATETASVAGSDQVAGTQPAGAPERKWYVVHTYSGYEAKVKANLEKRVESMLMQDKIFRVIVPTEDEIEYKEGRKVITKKKVFPGYVLVEMVMSDDSWYVVRNTPGVTGFVGSGNRPVPLDPAEVRNILRHMGVDEPRPKVMYEDGESVKVISGPFMGFIGKVREVNLDKGKLRVFVSMFGRETPVELDFSQVEKL
ncbi:MAG: transcription termination/antitermination protein NusG [Firmicutes bacterium]|nr:transcription termination/antitermination protein NusG [Bacillota bacterium]